jgi:XapX domain-containing protein
VGSELSQVEFLRTGAWIGLAELTWGDVKYWRLPLRRVRIADANGVRDEVAVIERTISMGYIISLGVGFAVGLLYWLLKVQSPAPPLIALAGLLGMVLGEHAIPVVKSQLFTQTRTVEVAEPMKSSAAQKPMTPGATKEGG